jgi:hypothetical protein
MTGSRRRKEKKAKIFSSSQKGCFIFIIDQRIWKKKEEPQNRCTFCCLIFFAPTKINKNNGIKIKLN